MGSGDFTTDLYLPAARIQLLCYRNRLVNPSSPPPPYNLEIQPGLPRQLARAWLKLGIAALIGSGLPVLLIVFSRTPGIQEFFPSKDIFRAALVVHVDLTVLVWFMSFAAVLWSLAGSRALAALGWIGFWLAVTGTVLLAVSPFFPDAHPLLNNYIPVLDQPVFFAGLLVSAIGYGLALLRALFTTFPSVPMANGEIVLRFGIFLSAVAGALALAGFAVSWLAAPAFEGHALYEAVFWGGGHVLQFQHALLLLVAWLWLASTLGATPRAKPRTVALLFGLAALPLLAMPLIYLKWPVGSARHVAAFARLMQDGHSLMVPLMAIAALPLLRVWRISSPAKSAFLASFLLFVLGGVLAYMIRGVNVVIPAHYHGSIVGITLAFMGLAYVLLPRLGFAAAEGRMARWQPYVYGGGQLMHVLGLAISGGYGVQRKVAGAEQGLTELPQQISMGVMGLGGGIAIIGGLMFVIVCLKAMTRHK